MVSKATGIKMYVSLSGEYLESFLIATASDTPPGVDCVDEI